MAIYRSYDQTALDRQYDLRGTVVDVGDHLAYRERASARVRAEVPFRADIAYGTSEAERFDLFSPASAPAGGAPALVYIHGGYWQMSDKSDTSYLAPALTGAGIAFATINYALCPAVSIADIVHQARSAIAWIWRNAASLGIDRDRIVVGGHSAGGHLTAMAAATDWPAFAADLPADLVKGAAPTSGLYDLEPIRLCFHNAVLALDAEAVRQLSPIGLTPRLAGPMVIAVGENETDEFRRQQADFVESWRARGLDVRAMEVPGRHHYSIVREIADGEHPLFRAVVEMVHAAGRRAR